MKLKVKLKLLTSTATQPRYATEGSAGLDLHADIREPASILPGDRVLIPTGIAVQPEPGYAAFLMPRSGLGHKKGLVLGNLTGVIDETYTGEVLVSCWNTGDSTFVVEPGMRICQMVFLPVAEAEFNVVDELDDTARGAGGFGSTGVSA